MFITGVTPLTGALSHEVDHIPWQQSNYMHVLVTTLLKKTQQHESSVFTVCLGNEAPATLPVVPDHKVPAAEAPPQAPPLQTGTIHLTSDLQTSCQDALDRQASPPLEPTHPLPTTSPSPGCYDGRSKIRSHFPVMWSVSGW